MLGLPMRCFLPGRRVVGWVLLAVGLGMVPGVRAQGVGSAAVALCQPADIDASFYYADEAAGSQAAGHQVIGVNLRNTGAAACGLRGELGAGFSAEGHSMQVPTCWFCTADGRHDAAAVKRNDGFVLEAGATAHVTYRWASVESDHMVWDPKGVACQRVGWGNFYAKWGGPVSYLFDPAWWKPKVCSVIDISGYEVGAMPESVVADARLKVEIAQEPIYAQEYADELVKVRLRLESPRGTVVVPRHCPELFTITRQPKEKGDDSLWTRFDTLFPDDYSTLVNAAGKPTMSAYGYPTELPAQFKGYTRQCELETDFNTAMVTIPASKLGRMKHIVWRAETKAGAPVFVTADTDVKVLDPATLPQHWGQQLQGVGAGLSVDKTTVRFGEDLRLHLHWENFAATQPLAEGECGEPQPSLELQDAQHHVLKSYPTDYMEACNSHGFGPFAMKTGVQRNVYLDLPYGKKGYTLSQYGEAVPITAPGIYYLVTVWSARALAKGADSDKNSVPFGDRDFGPVVATVRSEPVRIEVLPGK